MYWWGDTSIPARLVIRNNEELKLTSTSGIAFDTSAMDPVALGNVDSPGGTANQAEQPEFSILDLLQLYRQTLYLAVKETELTTAGHQCDESGLAAIRTDLANCCDLRFDPPDCIRLSKKSGACQKIVSCWKKLLGGILTFMDPRSFGIDDRGLMTVCKLLLQAVYTLSKSFTKIRYQKTLVQPIVGSGQVLLADLRCIDLEDRIYAKSGPEVLNGTDFSGHAESGRHFSPHNSRPLYKTNSDIPRTSDTTSNSHQSRGKLVLGPTRVVPATITLSSLLTEPVREQYNPNKPFIVSEHRNNGSPVDDSSSCVGMWKSKRKNKPVKRQLPSYAPDVASSWGGGGADNVVSTELQTTSVESRLVK